MSIRLNSSNSPVSGASALQSPPLNTHTKAPSKDVEESDIKNPSELSLDWTKYNNFDTASMEALKQTILQRLTAIINETFAGVKSFEDYAKEHPTTTNTPWNTHPSSPRIPATSKPPGDKNTHPADITDDTPGAHSPGASTRPAGGPSNTKPAVPITKTVEVHDAAGLKSALASATSGTEIKLADGVYNGTFEMNNKDGVTISGSQNAVIKGGSGFGLHLTNCNNNTLTGFTVSDSKKGIMLDGSNNNVLDGLTVDRIAQEGIHFRANSSNNTLKNSFIDNTGLVDAGFGEGVYIGSAPSNMANDHSDGNQIIGNTFGNGIRAENIDIKEGTSNGVISGNHFNVTGVSGANYSDSAVDVKDGATNYKIEGNDTKGRAKIDIETHNKSASANSISNNTYG